MAAVAIHTHYHHHHHHSRIALAVQLVGMAGKTNKYVVSCLLLCHLQLALALPL